jgi:polyisoprenoid-binding protein YceI
MLFSGVISMKHYMILVLLCFLFISSPLFADNKTLNIDTEASVVEWLGKKVAGQHNGTLKIKNGTVEISDNQIKGGSFVLDMTSIVNLDIEGEEWRTKLENHLKSDDFFNVSEFPEGKFEIQNISKKDDGKLDIEGTLTIKNISKPVVFAADLMNHNGVYHAKAKTTINRTEWDIRYNSGKWFDPNQLGDKLIYDEIEIGLDIKTAALN